MRTETLTAENVGVATPPYRLRIGIAPVDAKRAAALRADFESKGTDSGELMVDPKPELNGQMFRLTDSDPNRWLVDRGYRRWIPDPETYNNLFRDWHVTTNPNLFDISKGDPVSRGAVLIRADGQAPVYLVDQSVKRWITSPAAMDKYNFNWDRVYVLPPIVVASIRSADSIS